MSQGLNENQTTKFGGDEADFEVQIVRRYEKLKANVEN